jgi:manganese-dependent ADP-ribose/CDP-alcohol diphosphatase
MNTFLKKFSKTKHIFPLTVAYSKRSKLQKKMSPVKTDEKEPLVTFGILADVQYANVDDLEQYGRIRYYRNSLNLLRSAISDWKSLKRTSNEIKFVLDLGDLVDAVKSKAYFDELNLILNEIDTLFDTNTLNNVLHVWGNHEVYGCTRRTIVNIPRMATAKHLNQFNEKSMNNYYFKDITDRVRLVVLDLYEISPLGYEEHDEIYQNSNKFLEAQQNLKRNSKDPKEIQFLTRFAVYGGAASDQQLKWLENQLIECERLDKKIILAGHIPLLVETGGLFVAWNSEEILKLIWLFKRVVLCYLCGHAHIGKYFLDNNGIHHLTVTAILETAPNTHNSYCIAQVFEDRLVVKNQSPVGGFTVNFN